MARILTVEDSPDIRVLVRRLLEAAGHEVLTAADGRAGVEAARRLRPDLVLMDLTLPLLSGWEATRQIKSDPSTSAIPVLAVTALAMHGERERAIAAGCDGVIPKPIDEETFASEIAARLNVEKIREEALPGAASPPRKAVREPPGRILLVDDQPGAALLLKTEMEAAGHAVTMAASFAEALALFSPGRYDLAVIEALLGTEGGYALTAELIGRSPEYLPVLLVTAGTIDRERGFQAGADDFIGKPVESAELRARTRSLLRMARAMRERVQPVRGRSEAYQNLVELDRLRSDFLSTISHELRTPLNTIILLSHLLDREADSTADQARRKHDVRVIQESAETLLRMINNILDLAKLEAGQRDLHPGRFALGQFLREVTDMLESHAKAKGLDLELELDSGLPETVSLDREKLARVLINLLSNAVQYTKTGSVVLKVSAWQESISFEIADTGTGIPAHLVAKAFEPFRQIRTGRDAPRGTGLGLPISKQLVELMGSDLFFDSPEGIGTRASFTLPELPEAEDAPPPAGRRRKREARVRRDTSGRTYGVLIVEDDVSSRYGLKSLLESEGYGVREAGTLAEAEAAARDDPPDVVVLDITLPDGDGAEWLKLIRKRDGGFPFPVIALTGVTADEDRRRIEQAGVRALLSKPVNIPLLLGALNASLSKWGQR